MTRSNEEATGKMERHLGMVRAVEDFLLDNGQGFKTKAAGEGKKPRKNSDRTTGKDRASRRLG